MLKDKLYEYYRLLEESNKKKRDQSVFRASSAGECARKLAYKKLGYESEPIQPRGLAVMQHGRRIERHVYAMFRSLDLIKDKQKDLELKINDNITITGHIDGLIDFEGEKVVLDIKSISTNGFRLVQKGIVDYKYICQMTVYMKALGLSRAVLFFYEKDTSDMAEFVVHYDKRLMDRIALRFTEVFEATKENMPKREYFPDANGKLQYPCSYCMYAMECYPYKLDFIKGKPVKIVK